MSGLMSFLAGVAMLNGYHGWTADWRIIITILGWLLVIAGIIRIMLPVAAVVLAITVYSEGYAMAIAGIIILVIGGFLSFKGYRAATK